MGNYKPQVDYEPHDFITSTLSFTCNGVTTIGEALDTVEAERMDDEWQDPFDVADGVAIDVRSLSQKGTFKFTFLEASSTTDALVTAMNTGMPISFAFKDENAPNLNVSSGNCRIRKHPVIKRGRQPDTPQWEFVCRHMKMAGGSYRLQQTV